METPGRTVTGVSVRGVLCVQGGCVGLPQISTGSSGCRGESSHESHLMVHELTWVFRVICSHQMRAPPLRGAHQERGLSVPNEADEISITVRPC